MDLGQYAGPGAAPVIAALIVAINRAGLDKRWSPLLAIACGIAWNVGLTLADVAVAKDPAEAVLWGIIAGLLASGIFSVGKTVVGK